MNYNNENTQNEVAGNKREKSRNIGIYQFFEILQLEAIVADLRSKIYPRIKDKNYWRKVYEYKKGTTFDIAERNKVEGIELPTIFTDDEMLQEYKNRIFGSGGYPHFMYKDKEQELSQSYYDSQNYYAKDSDVICKDNDGVVKIGKVKYYQPNSKKVKVTLDNKVVELDINRVTRIL